MNLNLEHMCDDQTPVEVIDRVDTDFVIANNLRYRTFCKRKEPPKIKCSPPTRESAVHHVRRAYNIQTMRYAADSESTPNLKYKKIKGTQSEPFPTYCLAAVAPASILKVVAMFLQVPEFLCRRSTPCIMYCKCEGDSDYEEEKKENGGI